MRVYRTYDGRIFDVVKLLSHFQSREDLYDAISLAAGIPSDDVICMTNSGQQINDEVLDELQDLPAKTLEDLELFVFHRRFLYADVEALTADLEEPLELEAPLEEPEIEHSPTPRSLTKLVDWCELLLSDMGTHNTRSRERLDQLSIIHRSTSIALSNLLTHASSIRETATSLQTTAGEELTRMQGLLQGHETDLEILSLVPINPKLLSAPDPSKAKPKERTLGDYISPSKMGAVFQACSSVQAELEGKLLSVKESESQMEEDTEGLRHEVEATNISPSQETYEESHRALERGKELLSWVMATCLPDEQGWSAAAKLAEDDSMMKRLDEAIGELILLDEVIRESLRRLTADKNEIIARNAHLLSDISSLQSDFADLGVDLMQLDNEFTSSRVDGFRHLARLKNMLKVYGSTLIEIQRRRNFENKFLLRSQALAEVMATLSESERGSRAKFQAQVVGALPWEVKGLNENTPNLEISSGKKASEEEIDIQQADIDELFRTLDMVEEKLRVRHKTNATPIAEVRDAFRQALARFDETEPDFAKLVKVDLLGQREDETDSEDDGPRRSDKVGDDANGSAARSVRLEKELQELKMEYGEKDRARSEAHDQELAALSAELSKIRAEHRHLEHDIETERQQHEDIRKQLEGRIADADVEAARRVNLEEEVGRLRRDVENAHRAEMEAKVEVSEEVERANELEAQLHEVQVELEQAKEAKNDACNQIEALLDKDTSVGKQLSLAQERYDDLSHQLSLARIEERKAREAQHEVESARDKALRNYRAEADGDRAILEERLRTQGVELEQANETLRRRNREVREVSEGLKNLQGQLAAADEAHEKLVRQLEAGEEKSMEAEMAKRQSERNLEAIVEKIRPLLSKIIELHDTLRDMPALSTSAAKLLKDSKKEGEKSPEDEQKKQAIEAFTTAGDAATVELIIELLALFTKMSILDSVNSKLETLPSLCRKWMRAYKYSNEKVQRHQALLREKISFRSFSIGDLALFLPTRNNSGKPWAAFNINFPHYFLNFSGSKENEQLRESLQTKEWIVARITKIESRVATANKPGQAEEDGNPFQLTEGVRFFLLDVEGWNGSSTLNASSRAPLPTRDSSNSITATNPPMPTRESSSSLHPNPKAQLAKRNSTISVNSTKAASPRRNSSTSTTASIRAPIPIPALKNSPTVSTSTTVKGDHISASPALISSPALLPILFPFPSR